VTSETKPLSGVKIRLEGSKLTSIWTDANGYYTFSDLRAGGSYTIAPVAAMNFKPSSRSFNDLRRDESADFFTQSDAVTPTSTLTPTVTTTSTSNQECSATDQLSASRTVKSFEPGWRQQIQREQARIIRENVPNNIEHAEASVEKIDFQYLFTKPCAMAVVTVTYTWRVSWPANPVSPGKNKNIPRERRYICGKGFGMWACTLALR
jgi:hypothetical protein